MKSTITFYRVHCDVDLYRYFLVESGWPMVDGDDVVFDGKPWRDVWRPPSVTVYQPRLREGAFWGILGGRGAALCVSPEALEHGHLEDFLQRAGELLPIPYEDRAFRLLNVTECIDALDREETTYAEPVESDEFELAGLDEEIKQRLVERGHVPSVEEPVFRLDRLGGQLFKLPETAITDIYYWERSEDGPEEQLRAYCEREGLTGLRFDFLYSTDSPW